MREQEKLAVIDDTEVRLRREIEDLKRQLEQRKQPSAARPSKRVLWTIAFLALTAEGRAPRVTVVTVDRSARKSERVLPGNSQAVTEAPVLSRSNGYVKHRY